MATSTITATLSKKVGNDLYYIYPKTAATMVKMSPTDATSVKAKIDAHDTKINEITNTISCVSTEASTRYYQNSALPTINGVNIFSSNRYKGYIDIRIDRAGRILQYIDWDGNLFIPGEIKGPTIDDIWVAIKALQA